MINTQSGKVLTVTGSKDVEGQIVDVAVNKGTVNQKWTLIYKDTIKDRTEGFNS
jgi:hypothetical protein